MFPFLECTAARHPLLAPYYAGYFQFRVFMYHLKKAFPDQLCNIAPAHLSHYLFQFTTITENYYHVA